MLKIILIFAELERKMTSERVTSIMLDRAERGLWNGANIPFGYYWDKESKYPAVLENEAAIIKKIFSMYEQGASTIQITRWLHQNQVHTKRGGYWNAKTVADIIRNPFYKGTLRYNYREAPHGKRKSPSEWIIKENNHPSLIPEPQWAHVNAIMDANALAKGLVGQQNRRKYTHIFGGILRCKCGAGTSANRDTPRTDGWAPSTYRCAHVNRGITTGCRMISDVYLGPFIFTYLKNIINLQHSEAGAMSVAEIERRLLKGDIFKDISHVHGLDALLSLLKAKPNMRFQLPAAAAEENISSADTSLHTEKLKLQRALDRLKQLYLYSDDAMSEKDFIGEQKAITGKLAHIEQKLKHGQHTTPSDDVSFLSAASNFSLTTELDASGTLDYRELSMHTDAELLKSFVRTAIKTIHFDGKQVLKIIFTNNMVHTFKYK